MECRGTDVESDVKCAEADQQSLSTRRRRVATNVHQRSMIEIDEPNFCKRELGVDYEHEQIFQRANET